MFQDLFDLHSSYQLQEERDRIERSIGCVKKREHVEKIINFTFLRKSWLDGVSLYLRFICNLSVNLSVIVLTLHGGALSETSAS